MKRQPTLILIFLLFGILFSAAAANAVDMDMVIREVKREVSGERARQYTMRLWRYDRWYNVPMMVKAAEEARTIMRERDFDEAELVDTPLDGKTQFGTWTNPIGWDCTQATLEVIEPSGLPDEYRFLCNYQDNPTSLIGWSCPTPAGGLETELVLLDRANRESLAEIDARGKIILISSNTGGMKRHLDDFGVPGLVSDQIESRNSDFIHANNWMNTWSDRPGGWLMNASDSKNNFGFSISQKKGDYLRDLLRSGRKVVVRAVIDSRYYTGGTFPYVTGCIRGTGDEEVLIAGHLFEWGANDDATGCASMIEALGTINDLIDSGKLPRPKRSVRCWMGQELYGSLAYTAHNLERMRERTICALVCDTPAENYDLATTGLNLMMSFNNAPSYTDGVLPEIARRYYDRYEPLRLWRVTPYASGRDNFFCDPMIGVDTNCISMNNGGHLHHNSMDTIDKTDPRTLGEMTALNAAYLYYMAAADFEDVPLISRLAYERGITVINEKAAEMRERLAETGGDGAALGRLLHEGRRDIEYYAGLQCDALSKITRLVDGDRREDVRDYLKGYLEDLKDFGEMQADRFEDELRAAAKMHETNIVTYKPPFGEVEKLQAEIVPKRFHIGPMSYDGIPVEECIGSPRWWSATNWVTAAYWWCDGERDLNEIRELAEIEAGRSMGDFDLVGFFRFLEKYDMVEFVD